MSEPIKKPNHKPESYQPSEKPEMIRLAEKYRHTATISEIKAFIAVSGEPPKSNKLKNIRRLWHENKSENFFLEGSLASIMQAIGERKEYNYWFFNALCGSAFVMHYGFKSENSEGLSSVFIPEIVIHAFDTCGYGCLYIDAETIKENPDDVVSAVKTSINRGIPVITPGVSNLSLTNLNGNKDFHDYFGAWSVIGGYEEDGAFNVNVYPENIETDEIGYVKIEKPFENSKGLFILTEKITNPDLKTVYKNIIMAIPALLALEPKDGDCFGKNAYYKWADTMLNDSLFESDFDDWQIFNSPWVTVGTNGVFFRGDFKGNFFNDLKELMPDFTTAQEVHNIYGVKMKEKFDAIHKLYSPDFKDFFCGKEFLRSRETRGKIAELLKEIGDMHDEIISVIGGNDL